MKGKYVVAFLALFAMALLIVPTAARAGTFDGTDMQLDLCNSGDTNAGACGTNTVNFDDGGTGSISFNKVGVGVWNINSGNAFGSDGLLMLPHLLDLNAINMTDSGGGTSSNALKMELTLTGLTVPLPSLTAIQAMGGTLNFGGTATYTSQAWISTTNSAFCAANCSSLTSLLSFTGTGTQGFGGSTIGTSGTVNPYSLTLVITLSSATSGHASFDSSLDIPEPATLSVLGAALLGLGTGIRRKLAKV
ncbi:MAG: PEP-CTERM sorting domain-containing protein [Candidatus Korobacteraceae bacterium]